MCTYTHTCTTHTYTHLHICAKTYKQNLKRILPSKLSSSTSFFLCCLLSSLSSHSLASSKDTFFPLTFIYTYHGVKKESTESSVFRVRERWLWLPNPLRSSWVKLDSLLSFSEVHPWLGEVASHSVLDWAESKRHCKPLLNLLLELLSLSNLASRLHSSIYWKVPVSLLIVPSFSKSWESKRRHKEGGVWLGLAQLPLPELKETLLAVHSCGISFSSSPQKTLSNSSWWGRRLGSVSIWEHGVS